VRVGGRYQVDAPGSPGNMGVSGEYLEIERPDRLAFTWQWRGEDTVTTVTIDLHDAHGSTELVLVHDGFADPAEADQHELGWRSCLDRLPGWLATRA
jgi:uncharacterized protein YndB with AHSA1/START domain